MEYILLAIMAYAIILNCMAITMVRTVKTHQRPIRPQNAQVERIVLDSTHCRACNVLLVEHNHGCRETDLRQVPIVADIETPDIIIDTTPDTPDVKIKQGEDVKMELRTHTNQDTVNLSDIEAKLLLDYYRYKDIVNQIKTDYPALAKQYGILDDAKPKRTRKIAPVAEESPNELGLIDTLAHYKTGKNKLGGSCGMVHTFTIKQSNLDRIQARFNEVWGAMPERERLVSKCPDCTGHYRTSFERDCTVLLDDEEFEGRKIRKLMTRYTCDNCSKTELNEQSGLYLKSSKSEPIPCPLPETELDTIADEPLDTNIVCDSCKQVFDQDEMDGENCPFCGSQVLVTA